MKVASELCNKVSKTSQNILIYQGGTSFVDHLCYLCFVFVVLLGLFIAALWSPAGKGLTSLLSFMVFNCVFVTFPCCILGKCGT